MVDKSAVKPGLLVQSKGVLFQVSTVEDKHFTATQVYPIPNKTRVYSMTYDSVEPCSDRIYRSYLEAWNARGLKWAYKRKAPRTQARVPPKPKKRRATP